MKVRKKGIPKKKGLSSGKGLFARCEKMTVRKNSGF